MKKPVVLRIYQGEQLLGVKQFLDAQIVIGRQSEAQVPLDNDKVALIHAVIEEREGGGYYICDLGSETGTFRNGEKILDTEISSGDVIQIGDYRLEFYIGVPKPKAPPPQASALIESTDGVSEGSQPSMPPVNVAPAAPVEVPRTESNLNLSQSSDSKVDVVTPTPTPRSAPPTPVSTPISAIDSKPVSAIDSKSEASVTPEKRTETLHDAQSKPVIPSEAKTDSNPIEPSVQAKQTPKTPVKEEPPAPFVFESVKPPVDSPAPRNVEKSAGPARPVIQVAKPRSADHAPGMGMATTGGMLVEDRIHARRHRWARTFAPKSRFQDVNEFVRPSKGTVVEVLVAWRERVISSYHFTGKRVVTMGSHPENDIVLPVFAGKVRRVPILRLDAVAIAMLTPEMTGVLSRGQASSSFIELVRQNRMTKSGNNYSLAIEQGEMLKIDLSENVSLIVRYVSDSPKPLVAPFLDLTTSEFTGVILSIVLVGILGLYMFIYTPPKGLPDDALQQEPVRTAIFIAKPPTPPPLPPPVKVEVKAEATPVPTPPPQVVKATPQPKKTEEKKAVTQPKAVTNLTTKQDPGLSANAAPTKNKTGPRQLTSPKQGGAIKTATKEGSQLKSQQKDVSKSGVFSVFGGGGAQDQLSQNTQGAGELAGLASAATGRAGSATNRAGKGLGSELKDTGVGGNGKALEGIAGGISTTGRGSGNTGYGAGGLGTHAGTKIVSGGAEESFSGTIDKEAIRRVILSQLRVIKSCYERQLNRHPELAGKIVIGWEIGEQGRVVSAKVNSNELGSAEVGQCIVDKLKTWRFPEPPSSQIVEVAYPFFFSN